METKMIRAAIAAAICVVLQANAESSFELQREEFSKYFRQITGKDAPKGCVEFAIDPKVSKSGRDAYSIVSGNAAVAGRPPYRGDEQGRAGSPLPAVTIIGSNMRSVWYGLYDLLERRGGCHWFWDGDVVPKRETIDLSGLDVHEEAHFEYRGIRYFAHRGLTRFQAEHWGPGDWKREIDWTLKRRLNVLMLRIGQDDLFQRTFPDVCEYPDPAKRLPGAGTGYNDRTLFWSLQYRGELRRRLQKYAFDRGLMMPEDFGTMTHWYSRTPEDFLDKKNPPFLPLSNGQYGERNGQVWDIRDPKWADEYWKMTKVAVDAYGKDAPEPRLLHTIGLGERMCYTNRQQNFELKVKALDMFLDRAHRDYPDAKVLLAGWDFYLTWKPEEVRALLPRLDPKRDIIWDYEADLRPGPGRGRNNFTQWGVVGKFPYTYSIFLAYEDGLDARADYPLIEERQKIVQDDPACVGYILWPESSHTDTLCLRFFTANAWSNAPVPHGEVLNEFCASRYGEHAELMKSAWTAALPASRLLTWLGNVGRILHLGGLEPRWDDKKVEEWTTATKGAEPVFGMLAKLPWKDEFIRRDTIDIARMVLDRTIQARLYALSRDIARWRNEKCKVESVKCKVDGGNLVAQANAIAALTDKLADLLALHTDYSLWESYLRLDAVEKIKNPDFTKTLMENASCNYCRSHQYELVRHWYAPRVKAMAARLKDAVERGDRKAVIRTDANEERRAVRERPLESLRPTLPRTEENFRKVMHDVEKLLQ